MALGGSCTMTHDLPEVGWNPSVLIVEMIQPKSASVVGPVGPLSLDTVGLAD